MRHGSFVTPGTHHPTMSVALTSGLWNRPGDKPGAIGESPMPRQYIPRIYVPGTTTLLLTEARKMPCPSWSLPARVSCPFSLSGPGAICASCYADKGSYTQYPGVKRAQNIRYEW